MSTDSSRTAAALTTRPSTGTTSPGPTTSRSPTATSASGTVVTPASVRRRAEHGACSSRARRSWEARRWAAASRVRPVASISAISAPARYSWTTRVPPSARTAMRSTPAWRCRSAARTQPTAGTTADRVPSPQKRSARLPAPVSQAMAPTVRAAAVTVRRTGSSRGEATAAVGRLSRVVKVRWVMAYLGPPGAAIVGPGPHPAHRATTCWREGTSGPASGRADGARTCWSWTAPVGVEGQAGAGGDGSAGVGAQMVGVLLGPSGSSSPTRRGQSVRAGVRRTGPRRCR